MLKFVRNGHSVLHQWISIDNTTCVSPSQSGRNPCMYRNHRACNVGKSHFGSQVEIALRDIDMALREHASCSDYFRSY